MLLSDMKMITPGIAASLTPRELRTHEQRRQPQREPHGWRLRVPHLHVPHVHLRHRLP
ncbi:MAG TPA: hypothetical protein VFL46_08595 [Phycicoccus sp.]|nr:hypothetical protein [Phycicoccus sp.]